MRAPTIHHASPVKTLLVLGMLLSPATSNDQGLRVSDDARLVVAEPTSSLATEVSHARQTVALKELRHRTGLTWDQLAELFDVTRRSVHSWNNGNAMRPEHVQTLRRLVAFSRHVDRGLPSLTKAALFTPNDSGQIPFKALAKGDFAGAVVSMRSSSAKLPFLSEPPLKPVGSYARQRRPMDMVDITHERVPEIGTIAPARPIKIRNA